MRSLLGIITFIGVLAATEPAAAQSAHYKVIVNANNPAAVLMASEVSRIYLGIANVWPDRTLVLAVDQNTGSPVHDAFVREIIGKDSISLSRYWEQAIFSGRAVPPPTLSTDLEIMDFVRRNPGAIGYVSANTSLDAALKAIKIVR